MALRNVMATVIAVSYIVWSWRAGTRAKHAVEQARSASGADRG